MTFTNFIKRPVLSTVISILIVILGVIGLFSLPIEQYPDIAPPTVVVHTQYPGADAETVKNSVITPLEESINGVEGMDYISSTAGAGSAQISILFRQGMNADMCAVNVQNRVQQAQSLLPAEVTRIGVTVMKRQTSQVLMFTLTSEDGRYDDEFLTNYNNINIIPALKRIQGVGDVQSPGLKTYAMRIWLKPDVMKQYNLMPSDISAVLAEQNIEAAPGTFGEQSDVAYEYSLRYTGRLKSAEEFGDIIISSDVNGQTLKLKDVARIELGGQIYSVSMKNNNLPSVLGMVQQIAGSNANEIAKQVKAELEVCVYRGGDLHPYLHADTGVHRYLCVPAGLALYADSSDCRSCVAHRYVLLPEHNGLLYQLAHAIGLAAGYRHCGGRCHCGG